jgi:probable rRNA maturation factor
MIQYLAENVKLPVFEKKKINNWIKQITVNYDMKLGDIAYIFCDDEKILEINRQYLQHDYYTDIITFDYTVGHQISGDIFISLDTVKSNSDELKVDFTDELLRILIHGILHLCGQDDKTPELRKQMTLKENQALEILRKMG